MLLTLLKAKIHRATVTQCDLHYEGSISIDAGLLERSGILPHEQVDVLNITTGARFTTYTLAAPVGSGMIGINGAAARLAQKGDLVIIVAYARMDEAEAKSWQPRVLQVDANNRPLAPNLRVMET
jgi:aspartate 1-decarboxylase